MDLDQAFGLWFGAIAVIIAIPMIVLYFYTVTTEFPFLFVAVLLLVIVPPLLIYVSSNRSEGGENAE